MVLPHRSPYCDKRHTVKVSMSSGSESLRGFRWIQTNRIISSQIKMRNKMIQEINAWNYIESVLEEYRKQCDFV